VGHSRAELGERQHGLVFRTRSGKDLLEPTARNNKGAAIPNSWYRLLDRVKKFHPGFKRLGYHHLRETSGDLMRQFGDGETMAVRPPGRPRRNPPR
jgi:hypothetical protein